MVTEPDGGAKDLGMVDQAEPPEDLAVGPLADNEAWAFVSPEEDPFDDRPDVVDCERGIGWDTEPLDPEPSTVGIDTADCNYFGVAQATQRPIAAGETLAVQLWHFQLVGDGPAHVGVALDGDVLWETTVEIPSESELIYEEFEVVGGAPEGAQLVFHLHNHGLNSWNLIAIRDP